MFQSSKVLAKNSVDAFGYKLQDGKQIKCFAIPLRAVSM